MPETLEISEEELIPLFLLKANDGSVSGRTRMQKLAFLLDEEELTDYPAYDFIKYDYGPFSKQLLEDLERLENHGLVRITEETTFGGHTRYDHQLTEQGENVVDQLLEENEEVREIMDSAEKVIREYGTLSIRKLIETVYDKYPEYTENSVYKY